MMDWTKQTEDMFQAFTDTQKKLWGNWLEAAGQNSAQTQVADTWRKAVDTWEGAVKSGLEAQLEWSKSAADNMAAMPNVPKDVVDWARQTQDLSARWNEAQSQLWESYFGMVRKAVPVKMLGTLDDENEKLFTTWQDAVQQMIAAQSRWTEMWTAKAAEATAAASRSAKKKASAA